MKTSDIPTIEVLKACEIAHSGEFNLTTLFSGPKTKAPWEILMEKFNAPEKVVYSAMERDYKKGLLEYGVSLRTAWLSDKGYELLTKSKE